MKDFQIETARVYALEYVSEQNVPCLVPTHWHIQREDLHAQRGFHEGSAERPKPGTKT